VSNSIEGAAAGQGPAGRTPLFSIDARGVIRRTFQIYGDQASVLMPASAVVFTISALLRVGLTVASPDLALGFVDLIVSFVATTLFTGMVVELVADVQDGRRDASAAGLLRSVMPVLGQLIVVGVIAGIGILAGSMLVVVPGLLLATIWAVAAPVVVLEHLGAFRALGRSRELVRGNGWNVFAVVLLLVVLVFLAAVAIELGGQAAAGTGGRLVVMVVLGVLAAPISALAAAVLYFDLRRVHGAGGTVPEPELPPFQSGPFPPAAL
jgi:hypothetical protein